MLATSALSGTALFASCLLALPQNPLNQIAAAAPDDSGVLKVLVVSGKNNHDCEWTTPQLERLLEVTGRFDVDVTMDPGKTLADAAAVASYRAFVLDYNGPRWGEAAEKNFLAAVRGGAGVAVVHAANNPFPGWVEYEKMVALCWRKGTGHGRFHAFDVEVIDRDHPLTADMPDMAGHPDELYHRLVHMHGVDYRVLVHAMSSKESGGTGKHEPMVIVRQYGEGRVFHTPLGHVWRKRPETHASYDAPFRQLVARGTEWAATGVVTLPATAPNTLTAAERDAGFRLLFDGESTEGWRGFKREGFPDRGWRVDSGCLVHVNEGGGGDILVDELFGDFEFRFEWAVTKGANSGIIYRCTEAASTTWRTGPEYQVLDDGQSPGYESFSAGALYGLVKPAAKTLKPLGQFNSGRIVVRGKHVEHWLNGAKIVDCVMGGADWEQRIQASKFKAMPEFAKAAKGYIALQDHGNNVRYRSLRLRDLSGDGN